MLFLCCISLVTLKIAVYLHFNEKKMSPQSYFIKWIIISRLSLKNYERILKIVIKLYNDIGSHRTLLGKRHSYSFRSLSQRANTETIKIEPETIFGPCCCLMECCCWWWLFFNFKEIRRRTLFKVKQAY